MNSIRATDLNHIVLSGQLVVKNPLRYTPRGVAVSEARLQHDSEQIEAGLPRQVICEIALFALGEQARWLEAASLGSCVKITGFLGAKSRNSKTPVLHVQQIEFLEGNKNG